MTVIDDPVGRRPSLRWMMLVPLLMTVIVGFAGFAYYLDGVEYENRIADIDDELVRARSATLPQSAPEGPVAGDPAGTGGPLETDDDGVAPPVNFVIEADGSVVDPNSALPFTDDMFDGLQELDGFQTLDEPRYRVSVAALPGGATSVTALALDGVDAAVSDFRRALLSGGVVIVVLVAVVIWLLTSTLIRPVRKMTAVATRVADGELDTEVPRPEGSAETATLARDLDRMLTRLRATLERSEQSAAEAQVARDDMQRFVADVSHEFRTPLTALRGYSELYDQGMLDEPGALDRAMERVGSESDRLHHMVTEMLELTRHSATSADVVAVDLGGIARDVVDDLCAAYPDREIDLGLPPETVTTVGVAGRLHQAVLNLGANACVYADATSPIRIVVEESLEDTAAVSVIDHGPGIDPEVRDRVMLPFVRADSSRSRHLGGGAGLGLAVAHRIAGESGGSLTLRDTPGGGSTFVLTLPVGPADDD